jgi:hypothetical protein
VLPGVETAVFAALMPWLMARTLCLGWRSSSCVSGPDVRNCRGYLRLFGCCLSVLTWPRKKHVEGESRGVAPHFTRHMYSLRYILMYSMRIHVITRNLTKDWTYM